ncbi:hypothetical protein SEA_BILLNYE_30 [Streptomyces phage BillNye]|uniref:Tail terminator n=2 Tax=Wilnyevirus billnye TaxID=2560486 RepID=A0A2L1IVM5_9CAUD|nr:hypothetical protein FDJ30_gp201 [Streptomyces phage BillNye]AVD99232.1 hypothetical protein SEA_BILLNYE_30 [Streptomyces phage BillNye]QBZ72316.1 hypothetical protein SEA_CIRCINUS_32 [Streptomyces phage Circinus]
MTDYRTMGAHQINKYLWGKLKDFEYKAGVKAFGAYGTGTGQKNLTPIIPTQQQPQFLDIAGGAPFLVYNYIVSPYAAEWWLCREQCAYVIYDNDEERLRAIHGYMIDLLKRMDWTARDVNASSTTDKRFDFKYVQLTSASGPDEFSTEGGRTGAMVVVNYEYTMDMETNDSGLRV